MGVRVLVVDDDDQFRAAARQLLMAEGLDVVGEARNGAEAFLVTRDLRPGLVLLDVQLPDFDGFEVSRRLLEQDDPPLVVLTSTRSATAYRSRLANSAVRGFISKSDLSAASLAALIG